MVPHHCSWSGNSAVFSGSGRRWNTTTSVTTDVPDWVVNVLLGSRTAPTNSPQRAICFRWAGLTASSVYRLVRATSSPPGASAASDLARQKLCSDTGWSTVLRPSLVLTSAKGTFPIAAVKPDPLYAWRGAVTTVCSGWIAAHIRAVVGSISTPVICTGRSSVGAAAKNTPGPLPGSITSPPSKPRSVTSFHSASATSGDV